MKKNRMMRLASVLLVLTLLSTSVISGTFAKYVTTGSVSDTARVAKFGVVISTSGTLYSDAYVKQLEGNTPASAWSTTYADPDKITVATASAGADHLVAPGTESYGSGLTFGISGTPEVATQITGTIKARDIYLKAGTYGVMVKATVTRDNFATLKAADTLYTESSGTYTAVPASGADTYSSSANYFILTTQCTIGSDYYPVKYTLDGSTSAAGKTEDIANALTTVMNGTAVAGADANGLTTYTIPDTAKVFDANTNLGGSGMLGNEQLTWEWEFGSTGNDPQDTILGDMMAPLGTDSFVVCEESGTYKNVVYDASNKLVKQSDSTTVIASLQTSFDITLTVSQVD